jgi:hypothetical protein
MEFSLVLGHVELRCNLLQEKKMHNKFWEIFVSSCVQSEIITIEHTSQKRESCVEGAPEVDA